MSSLQPDYLLIDAGVFPVAIEPQLLSDGAHKTELTISHLLRHAVGGDLARINPFAVSHLAIGAADQILNPGRE